MPRRANNFDHVRDMATRTIALDAEKLELNRAELDLYHFLMETTAKVLAARANVTPAKPERKRRPKQQKPEVQA